MRPTLKEAARRPAVVLVFLLLALALIVGPAYVQRAAVLLGSSDPPLLESSASKARPEATSGFCEARCRPPKADEPEAHAQGAASNESTPPYPKLVHYIWFQGPTSSFGVLASFPLSSAFLSVLAAQVSLRFHLSSSVSSPEPLGPWWSSVRPLVTVVPARTADSIFGHPVRELAHKADILRIEILRARGELEPRGGIYLDTDVLPLRSFDPLLKGPAPVTMGLQARLASPIT
eukprot:tig00021276_g19893.t1